MTIDDPEHDRTLDNQHQKIARKIQNGNLPREDHQIRKAIADALQKAINDSIEYNFSLSRPSPGRSSD